MGQDRTERSGHDAHTTSRPSDVGSQPSPDARYQAAEAGTDPAAQRSIAQQQPNSQTSQKPREDHQNDFGLPLDRHSSALAPDSPPAAPPAACRTECRGCQDHRGLQNSGGTARRAAAARQCQAPEPASVDGLSSQRTGGSADEHRGRDDVLPRPANGVTPRKQQGGACRCIRRGSPADRLADRRLPERALGPPRLPTPPPSPRRRNQRRRGPPARWQSQPCAGSGAGGRRKSPTGRLANSRNSQNARSDRRA